MNKTIRDVPPNNLLKFSDEDNLFLLGHSDCLALVTGGLGVLAPHTEAPVVTETTVGADLLQTLEILTKLVVEDVGHHLGSLAVLDVTLPVQEPVRDLVLTGVLTKKIKVINIQTYFRIACAKSISNNLTRLDGVKAGHDGAPVVGAGRLSYLGGYEVQDPRGGHVVEIEHLGW